ncbi:MAG: type II secretion system F family protein [Chthonomonadales bacterium]|nr:type II secretion system F family protein [Chthonomonadales bacterium]
MAFWRYEATDARGKVVLGTMDAASEPEVRARLGQMGYQPVAISPSPSRGATTKPANGAVISAPPRSVAASAAAGRGGASAHELAVFFRQFASMARAGISVFQALDNLAPRIGSAPLRAAAADVAASARAGGRASDVMERYPRLFAPHVVAGVRAGETGGFLEIVLDEIALGYEQEEAFYKGLWLPRTLILQELLALAIAQPLFPTLFPNARFGEYLLLAFGRNVPILLALLLVGRWALARLKLPRYRAWRDAWVLRLPAFGDLVRQNALAAFVRMLRRLYNAGLGPAGAWEGAMSVAPNRVIRERLRASHDMVRSGVPLHEAFTATGLFASEAEQLLATGVVTGQVVEMLDRVAEYYQGNVDRAFGNARFWMYRIGISLFLAIGGVVIILMARTYFSAVFHFTDGWAD